ncbi:MAG: 16S rRNA (uracil(1498)-N(3))-methyltransferase [Alphaproteobacteria bacterium]|nr:16S rRNA (uracil(1498)-N(3))-methyltransferase [Alphaproteobacteria bacterium]
MTEDGDNLTYPGGGVRLYVEGSLGEAARVVPGSEQAHYLIHVMRAKEGSRLCLFNGRDGEWAARVAEVSKRGCVLICERKLAEQAEAPDLWLVFAPVKKTPADYVTQKATELGVRLLQPIITRRTIVRRVNAERMRANAVEAAEQSGRLTVPEVRDAVDLEKLLADWPAERRLLFCDEAGEAPPIAAALAAAPGGPWAVLVGPEGGFDPAERARIRAQGCVTPVSLGSRILRADTAGLAALAVWQALAGDWR